jgi:hypothetical protein
LERRGRQRWRKGKGGREVGGRARDRDRERCVAGRKRHRDSDRWTPPIRTDETLHENLK